MKSKLELAKQQISENHAEAKEEKNRTNVFGALENLSSILDKFTPEQIEQIYQIEKIDPVYFPGLSKAASNTILNLHQGNPNLSLDFIITTVSKLASRGRPWESLNAFSSFGKHCRSELSEVNINYLMKVNSDILEIVGSTIRNDMSEKEQSISGKFHNLFGFFNGHTPMQYNEGLIKSINKQMEYYYPGSTSKLQY
ncbi:hypothetical protein [Legionella sp. WA2022007384]